MHFSRFNNKKNYLYSLTLAWQYKTYITLKEGKFQPFLKLMNLYLANLEKTEIARSRLEIKSVKILIMVVTRLCYYKKREFQL